MSNTQNEMTNDVSAKKEFDYIICGGGTSGCVLAGRLAEDPHNYSILVIEAGKHNADLDAARMPGGWSALISSPETGWDIISEPSHGANDRQTILSRGKFLGGCSGCNATICIRGSKQDYDDWGIKGWSGDEVFDYMKKTETFHPKPWFNAENKFHGTDGPLHIEPHDLAPISKKVLESFQSRGLPLHHDMFTTGDIPHGCGHAPRTVYEGVRSTGADFVTDKFQRENVEIWTETLVDRVELEGSGDELKAVGVHVVLKSGKKFMAKAKKEVVISGGSICSPPMLLRSGIGPKDELAKLGISTVVDLPGVGKNLQDHMLVQIFYETLPGLTNDNLVYHDNALQTTLAAYKETKTGFLSTFPFGSFAFARLDDRLADSQLWNDSPRKPGRDPMNLTAAQPNIELWNTEVYGGPSQYQDFPTDHKHAFAMLVVLFGPQSRGSVTLRSADATETPVVHMNYLDNPLDMLVMSEGCRMANEIAMKGSGTKDVVIGAYPGNLKHSTFTTREEWEPYVKDHANTCFHPAGTTKMGDINDPMTVVDEKLRVKGVKNLRVVDVGIMPLLNGGHTQMPAYAIGEKAADLIKEDAGRQ